jgi:hypothetical protein
LEKEISNYVLKTFYLHLVYYNKLAVKDTNDTQKSASCLDLHLEIDNGGILKTKLYDRRDDVTFQYSTSLPLVAIFQQHQRKVSTVIFWRELSC